MSIPIDIFYDHVDKITKGFAKVDLDELETAIDILSTAVAFKNQIFTCGNGASAAIAQHMACDYTKGAASESFKPRVVSLSANIPLISAIANDISYDEIYSYQLDKLANEHDVLVVFSSSGNSPNIIRAIEKAKELGITVIAFTGFTGGKARELADVNLYVPIDEYEATEDCHQALMQIIAKYLRKISNV